MTRVKFSVACTAIYQAELELPDGHSLKREDVLEFIHAKLHEVPVEDLTWLSDLSPEEAVTAEDIQYITSETGDNNI